MENMGLTEFIILIKLLLKWSIVATSDETNRENALNLVRRVVDDMVRTWGDVPDYKKLDDIPF